MKRALVALAFSSLLAAPAFAQQQTQPAIPDNGVGVDYTQPYVNDLLLRMEPLVSGNRVGRGIEIDCTAEAKALAEAPADAAIKQALDACLETFFKSMRNREFFAQPGPGPNHPLYRPDPAAPQGLRPIPRAPSHPNAQN